MQGPQGIDLGPGARADYHASEYGCATATATRRVRSVLEEAEIVLNRAPLAAVLGGSCASSGPWRAIAPRPFSSARTTTPGPTARGSSSTSSAARFPSHRARRAPTPCPRAEAQRRTVPLRFEPADSLPAGGGFPFIDDESTLLSRLRRAQGQIMESFDSAAYAADPEGERLRLLRLTTAKIDFVVSHCAPDTPQIPSSTGIEIRRLAAQWVDDIIASERGAREQLAMADDE